LGIQTTLEEVLKKDEKLGKTPTSKGHTQPKKGGETKNER
jgi:hypothetical protein